MKTKYLTVSQVSEILQVTTKTIRDKIKSGELPATKIFGQWRVSENTLNQLLQE